MKRIKGPRPTETLFVWSRLFKMKVDIKGVPHEWDERFWVTAATVDDAVALVDDILKKNAVDKIDFEPLGDMEASDKPPTSPRPHIYGQVVNVYPPENMDQVFPEDA